MSTPNATTASPATGPRLVSVRLITDDVARLVAFYEHVTGLPARWATPDFAEVVTPVGTLAVGSTRTVAGPLGGGLLGAADGPAPLSRAVVEFLVPDVDAEQRRLGDVLGEAVPEPVTMPWGNRSLLLRDPDGHVVNLFTPVTPAAIARAGG